MSFALSLDEPPRADILVNMRELALQLRISRQTLTTWLDRWPDFPIHQQGTNGREYKFNVPAVFAFLEAKREEQAASLSARDEALAQLTFPFDTDDDPPAPGVSLDDQLKAQRLRKMQREDALAEGRLVEVADLTDRLSTCFQQLHRALHTAIRQAARDHNLPDAVQRSLDTHIADAQRAFVREAARFLKSPPTLEPADEE